MKKTVLSALLISATCMTLSAQAEITAVTIGAYNWKTEVTAGRLYAPRLGEYDLNLDNFELKKEKNLTFYAILEHTTPYVPNVKFSHTQLEHSGPGFLNYSGNTYAIDNGIVNLDQTDLTAYYQVLDNVLQLDIGITIRNFDGFFSIDSGAGPAQTTLATTLPLLYGKAEFALPLGFGIGLEANVGTSGDETGVDTNFYAHYISPFGLGINAGYRILNTELESVVKGTDIAVFAEMDFKGSYIGLSYTF